VEDSGPAGNNGGAGLGAERGDLAELRATVMDDHRHVHPAGRPSYQR
jgi:hypothetical protein